MGNQAKNSATEEFGFALHRLQLNSAAVARELLNLGLPKPRSASQVAAAIRSSSRTLAPLSLPRNTRGMKRTSSSPSLVCA